MIKPKPGDVVWIREILVEVSNPQPYTVYIDWNGVIMESPSVSVIPDHPALRLLGLWLHEHIEDAIWGLSNCNIQGHPALQELRRILEKNQQ